MVRLCYPLTSKPVRRSIPCGIVASIDVHLLHNFIDNRVVHPERVVCRVLIHLSTFRPLFFRHAKFGRSLSIPFVMFFVVPHVLYEVNASSIFHCDTELGLMRLFQIQPNMFWRFSHFLKFDGKGKRSNVPDRSVQMAIQGPGAIPFHCSRFPLEPTQLRSCWINIYIIEGRIPLFFFLPSV